MNGPQTIGLDELVDGYVKTRDVTSDEHDYWCEFVDAVAGELTGIDGSPLDPAQVGVEVVDRTVAPSGTVSKPSDFHTPLHLESPAKPGMITGRVRMVGDSFTQFATPYLGAAFTDITVTHPNNPALDPQGTGQLLAEGETVVFELSERFVVGGRYAMLDTAVADEVGAVLAAHPVG